MEELRKTAADVLARLKEAGADRAVCRIYRSETQEFNVDGGTFSLFRTLFDKGIIMTAYRDGRKGSVSINRFDTKALDEAVANCISVMTSGEPDPAWEIAPLTENATFREGALVCDTELLFSRTKELLDTIAARHPSVVVEQMIASHTKSRSVFVNTNGVEYQSERGGYDLDLTYSAHDGEATSSFFGSTLLTADLDAPFYERGSVRRDLEDVERQIHPRAISGKFEGTVLLPPSCFSEFLWSAISNYVSDTVVLDGTGLWCRKLGERVTHEGLTVSLRPYDKAVALGERVTDDGFIAQDYNMIENGVLQVLPLSLYVANKTGGLRAPNSSGNLVVAPGTENLADLIAGISHGIVVGRFSGGSPGANGDFSGVAKNSFLIEDGKITDAVSETMISGNMQTLLYDLHGLSRETECDGTSVLPWAAFGSVTVSGK